MRVLCLFLLAAVALAETPLQFRRVSPESIGLFEDGRPVYVYNEGVMRKEGVAEDRYRCCYVHPLYAPNGVIVTDDFPADHTHHRGVFWVWPVVNIDGKRHDLWLMKGIKKRGLSAADVWVKGDAAGLEVENGWFVGERQMVREHVEIVAKTAEGNRRVLEFRLRFEATDTPVELRGDPTDDKGYGGFCVRFAPRKNTVITTDAGREPRDSNMVPHPWAQEEGLFKGGRAGLRIDIDPSSPGHPNGWCLRHYGFLGVNYPGNDGHTLRPGEPLEMKYQVTVFAADEH